MPPIESPSDTQSDADATGANAAARQASTTGNVGTNTVHNNPANVDRASSASPFRFEDHSSDEEFTLQDDKKHRKKNDHRRRHASGSSEDEGRDDDYIGDDEMVQDKMLDGMELEPSKTSGAVRKLDNGACVQESVAQTIGDDAAVRPQPAAAYAEMRKLYFRPFTSRTRGHAMCMYCKKTIVRSQIAAHVERHFSAVLNVPCPHCDWKFSEKKYRNKHVMQVHAAKSAFPCRVCRDVEPFRTLVDFEQHCQSDTHKAAEIENVGEADVGSSKERKQFRRRKLKLFEKRIDGPEFIVVDKNGNDIELVGNRQHVPAASLQYFPQQASVDIKVFREGFCMKCDKFIASNPTCDAFTEHCKQLHQQMTDEDIAAGWLSFWQQRQVNVAVPNYWRNEQTLDTVYAAAAESPSPNAGNETTLRSADEDAFQQFMRRLYAASKTFNSRKDASTKTNYSGGPSFNPADIDLSTDNWREVYCLLQNQYLEIQRLKRNSKQLPDGTRKIEAGDRKTHAKNWTPNTTDDRSASEDAQNSSSPQKRVFKRTMTFAMPPAKRGGHLPIKRRFVNNTKMANGVENSDDDSVASSPSVRDLATLVDGHGNNTSNNFPGGRPPVFFRNNGSTKKQPNTGKRVKSSALPANNLTITTATTKVICKFGSKTKSSVSAAEESTPPSSKMHASQPLKTVKHAKNAGGFSALQLSQQVPKQVDYSISSGSIFRQPPQPARPHDQQQIRQPTVAVNGLHAGSMRAAPVAAVLPAWSVPPPAPAYVPAGYSAGPQQNYVAPAAAGMQPPATLGPVPEDSLQPGHVVSYDMDEVQRLVAQGWRIERTFYNG